MRKVLPNDCEVQVFLDQSPEGVRFLVMDGEPSFHSLFAALGFAATPEGFVRAFPPTSLDVEPIFQRFQACLGPMLRQLSGEAPVPWEDALIRFAQIVGDQADWWLVGSTALAVRGVRVTPHDIDLVVGEDDYPRVNELVAEHLIEPPSRSEEWVARSFSRAFIGARVEWVAGVQEWIDAPSPSDFGPVAESRRELISWRGLKLRVPPIDLQLAVSKRRGLTGRVQSIESFLTEAG